MNLIIDGVIWVAYLLSLYFSIFLVLVYWDKKNIFNREKYYAPLSKTPLVSILVPAYNEEKTIIATLESINNLDYSKNLLDVIVINDGSKDSTPKKVQQYIKDKPHFRLISHKNCGKAASMNRALNLAKGEFFACLDADSFVERSTLKKMLSLYYQENDPQLAIVTPAMKVSSPQNILQKIQWLEYLVLIFISRLASQLDSLYVAPGPFSIYRTDIIKKLGGFDPKNITEDQEIAYRVQLHHYKIKQCPDGYVYTTAPHKLKPFYQQRKRWYLGSIICLHQYRNMIANKKYGDFGMMQMIKSTLGYILAITGIFIGIYLFLLPALRGIEKLVAIDFNLIPFLTNFNLNLEPLDFLLFDFKKIFVLGFLLLLSFFFFYKAHQNAGEKMTKFGWIPLIPYFAFYYLLKGCILILSLFEFSRKKKMRW